MDYYVEKKLKRLTELTNEALNIPYEEYETSEQPRQIKLLMDEVIEFLKKEFGVKDFPIDNKSLRSLTQQEAENHLKYFEQITPFVDLYASYSERLIPKIRQEAALKSYSTGIDKIIQTEENPEELLEKLIVIQKKELVKSKISSPSRLPLLETQLQLLELYYDELLNKRKKRKARRVKPNRKNKEPSVKVKSLLNHTFLSKPNEERQEIILALKQKFDKLTSYATKLIFWFENGLDPFTRTYSADDLPPNATKEEENENLKSAISIWPENESETEQYNHWLLKLIQDQHPQHNIEKLKKKYFDTINGNPLPKEFTKKEIEKIKKSLLADEKLQPDFRWFSLGYNSVVNKEDLIFKDSPDRFAPKASFFASGIASAHYQGFLEKQLTQFDLQESGITNANMQPSLSIKDFENFIYACDNVLDNTVGDLIEWEDHFKKESWEKNSFYGNGKFLTAEEVWHKDRDEAKTLAHKSKSHLKHLILIEKADRVLVYVQREVLKLLTRIEKFNSDHDLGHHKKMVNNQWFFELYTLVARYKKWLDETFSGEQQTTVTEEEVKKTEVLKSTAKSDLQVIKNLPASFIYIKKRANSQTNLNEALERLHDQKFVSPLTKAPMFKKIFSGQEITEPVIWIGTPTDLHYFILLLCIKSKKVEEIPGSHWKVACKCFVNK